MMIVRHGKTGARKTLRLPRCLRRGGMRAFDRGLNALCQRQVVGVLAIRATGLHEVRETRFEGS